MSMGALYCGAALSFYVTTASSLEAERMMRSLTNWVEMLENVARKSQIQMPPVCSLQMAQWGGCQKGNATVDVSLTSYIPSAIVSSALFHQTLSNGPSIGGR